jgi:hypothetical protein
LPDHRISVADEGYQPDERLWPPESAVRPDRRSAGRRHVADFGYHRSGSYLTGPGRGWLAGLELPAISRELVTDYLAVIDGLAPVIERIDGERHGASAERRCASGRTDAHCRDG